jgi:hypothetical protein
MREELRQHISFIYGPSAWDELVRTEARIRKEKREQEYRKAEIIQEIITWTVTIALLIVGIGILGFIIYLVK